MMTELIVLLSVLVAGSAAGADLQAGQA